MYSTGPGKIPPFGRSGVPPHGPGFELPAYSRPSESTETGFQAPPPPASSGNVHGSLTVTNFQRTAPDSASSA